MNEELYEQPRNVESEGMSYVQDESSDNALKIRLEVTPIHEQIRMFLMGEDYVTAPNGSIVRTQVTQPIMNKEGASSIMRWVKCLMNSSTVQGNLKDSKEHGRMMAEIHQGIGESMAWNRAYYGLKDVERRALTKQIVYMIHYYLTRTIGNKERDSYGMRTIERGVNTFMQKKAGVFK